MHFVQFRLPKASPPHLPSITEKDQFLALAIAALCGAFILAALPLTYCLHFILGDEMRAVHCLAVGYFLVAYPGYLATDTLDFVNDYLHLSSEWGVGGAATSGVNLGLRYRLRTCSLAVEEPKRSEIRLAAYFLAGLHVVWGYAQVLVQLDWVWWRDDYGHKVMEPCRMCIACIARVLWMGGVVVRRDVEFELLP